MTNSSDTTFFAELDDLVLGADTVADFLTELSIVAARALSADVGSEVSCGVTLKRVRSTRTVGGSSPRAVHLDRIEHRIGDGPCIAAIRVGETILMDDVETDSRWPEYQKALVSENCLSALGVPLYLDGEASAALNFFAEPRRAFTPDVISVAEGFGIIASRALRLMVKIGTSQDAAANLSAAMANRTAIDLACGIVVAQNNCTQAEAMEILRKASSNRNQKLRDLAEEMVFTVTGEKPVTHFT